MRVTERNYSDSTSQSKMNHKYTVLGTVRLPPPPREGERHQQDRLRANAWAPCGTKPGNTNSAPTHDFLLWLLLAVANQKQGRETDTG